jgi:hypothetical protein
MKLLVALALTLTIAPVSSFLGAGHRHHRSLLARVPSLQASIKQVHAREILDSRGNPTVEASVARPVGAAVAV